MITFTSTKRKEIKMKQIMITANDDGSCDVQEVQDGAPVGEPVPAGTVEDALSQAGSILGGGGEEAGAGEPPVAEDGGTSAEAQSSGSTSEVPAENPDEAAKKSFAQKKGMRPKTAPSMDDFMSMAGRQ
jgi:hypothetical protein